MCALPNALRAIAGVVPASRLERPSAAMVTSGVREIDSLTGGLPRGGLTEIYGATSSGRTTLTLAALAAATARGELCALIDVNDCFDPPSAEASGVNLEKLLWVRCGKTNNHEFARTATNPEKDESANLSVTDVKRALQAKQDVGTIMPAAKVWYGRSPARSERASHGSPRVHTDQEQENKRLSTTADENSRRKRDERQTANRVCSHAVEQALKAADLILQSGGFGMVVLDMGDVPVEIARRIPLTSWFRFSRAVENTPTVLLAIEHEACAKTCASMVLKTETRDQQPAGTQGNAPTHAQVFRGIQSVVEITRSRVEGPECSGKKPPRGVRAEFASRTKWAG